MEVCKAFNDAATTQGKPTVLVAKTLKGVYERREGGRDIDHCCCCR